jgi:hypothetical protein
MNGSKKLLGLAGHAVGFGLGGFVIIPQEVKNTVDEEKIQEIIPDGAFETLAGVSHFPLHHRPDHGALPHFFQIRRDCGRELLDLYLVHGILHLLGHDHETTEAEARRMAAKTQELFRLVHPELEEEIAWPDWK